jgi:hypothetical protein
MRFSVIMKEAPKNTTPGSDLHSVCKYFRAVCFGRCRRRTAPSLRGYWRAGSIIPLLGLAAVLDTSAL